MPNEIETIAILDSVRFIHLPPDRRTEICDALKTAMQALREQAEREKGCEYCLQGEDLAYGLDSMQRTGRIYIDGNLLTADLYSESMAVAVCCCPMCGRRLEVEQDG